MKLQSIALKNFLGFGDPGITLDGLGPREIFVGPNGSGKTSILHAIEFTSLAFNGGIQDGRPYVHKGETARAIEVDVTVELSSEELTALGTALLYCVTIQQNQQGAPQRVDSRLANLFVRQALSAEPRLLDSIFAGQVILSVRSTPGLEQRLRTYIELRHPEGSLFVQHFFMQLTSSNVELQSWQSFNILTEIYGIVEKGSHDVLNAATVDLDLLRERVLTATKQLNRSWLISRLRPASGQAVALSTEQMQTYQQHNMVIGAPPDLLGLRALLLKKGYAQQVIDLHSMFGVFYRRSLYRLGDSRTRPQRIAIQDASNQTGDADTLSGTELATLLFFMKTSWDSATRMRFEQIRSAFTELTGMKFDVILNPEIDESGSVQAQDSGLPNGSQPAEKAPPKFRHYPYVIFEESDYSYPSDFGAAGYFEILLVLSATIGPEKSFVLLDEPVLNLHPSKQRQLYRFLSEHGRRRENQLFIVTHSNSFVSTEDLAEATRFNRTQSGPQAMRLRFNDSRTRAQAIKDLSRNPRLLEALFARHVVLLEGDGETSSLPIWFEKCEKGNLISDTGAVFVSAGSDTHFGPLTRILEAWGVPYRIIADRKATDRVKTFGAVALVYPYDDFSDLLSSAYPTELTQAVAEFASFGKEKDPAVARILALDLPPPAAVVELWTQLRQFLENG